MKSKNAFTFSLLICVLALVMSQLCYARAGGGHSGGYGGGGHFGAGGYGGGSNFGAGGHGYGFTGKTSGAVNNHLGPTELAILTTLGLFVCTSSLLGFLLYIRKKRTSEALNELSASDPLWDEPSLNRLVEETYYKVQEAWRRRNPDLARHCMSERLYQHHLSLARTMLRKNHSPVMLDIDCKETAIIHVIDYLDNNKDSFKAYIVGSMIDYVMDDMTRQRISGSGDDKTFSEIWVFIRQNNQWLLDEIIPKTKTLDLLKMRNQIEQTQST